LLDHGVNIHAQTRASSEVPLHMAAGYGYLPIVDLLLKYGANPLARKYSGRTPLDIALIKNDLEMVRLLSKYTNEVG